jgi:hypothetical protein
MRARPVHEGDGGAALPAEPVAEARRQLDAAGAPADDDDAM